MTYTALYTKISQLPTSAQNEVSDYIEFLVNKYSKKKTLHPKAGCMQGNFNILPGFDESLDDFKEYME